MEEDIEILEEMKQNCLTKREYIDPKAERKAQAIENLIKGYRELEIRLELSKLNNENMYDMGWKACEIISIPKLKIEEKIEEVNKSLGYSPVNKILIEQVLQELMEDK